MKQTRSKVWLTLVAFAGFLEFAPSTASAKSIEICEGEVIFGSLDSSVGDCSFDSELPSAKQIMATCIMGDTCRVTARTERRGGSTWVTSVVKVEKLASLRDEDPAPSALPPSELEFRTGILGTYFSLFALAKYCAASGVAFEQGEIDNLQRQIKTLTDTSQVDRATIDRLWNTGQRALEANKAAIGRQDCASARQQIAYTVPGAFQSSQAVNPF